MGQTPSREVCVCLSASDSLTPHHTQHFHIPQVLLFPAMKPDETKGEISKRSAALAASVRKSQQQSSSGGGGGSSGGGN